MTDRSSGSCLSLLLQGTAALLAQKRRLAISAAGWKRNHGSSCVPQGARLALKSSICSCLGQGSSAKTPGEGLYEQGLLPLSGTGWERVALPTCLRMISSETVRKVPQTITSAKRSPTTKNSKEELQRDISQHRDQVILIQNCSPPSVLV